MNWRENYQEYIFILLAALAGYSPPFSFSPFFIGIIILLIIQLVWKNNSLGLLIGIFSFVVSIFFLGALVSELNEMKLDNSNSNEMSLSGLLIFCLLFILSISTTFKYWKKLLSISLSYDDHSGT